MLRTEQNTEEMAAEILDAAQSVLLSHKNLSADFEHGQHWITCLDCGAQWSAMDSTDRCGYSFEQVSDGDESCY